MISRRIQPRFNAFSRSCWFPRIMSSRERRMMLLHVAAAMDHPDIGGPRYPGWMSWGPRSIPIQCEGGLPRTDSDLKYLVRKGYLRFWRNTGEQGCSRSSVKIRRTYAIITDTGRGAIERGKL